jgi:hypothetical protein
MLMSVVVCVDADELLELSSLGSYDAVLSESEVAVVWSDQSSFGVVTPVPVAWCCCRLDGGATCPSRFTATVLALASSVIVWHAQLVAAVAYGRTRYGGEHSLLNLCQWSGSSSCWEHWCRGQQ